MPVLRPSRRYPLLPDDDAVGRLQVVRQETLAGLSEAYNELRNRGVRRWVSKAWHHDHDPTDPTHGGNPELDDPSGITRTYRVEVPTSLDVTHLALVAQFQRGGYKTSASMTATLKDLSGTVLDDPGGSGAVVWDSAVADLPHGEYLAADGSVLGIAGWPIAVVSTGVRVQEPTGSPTRPRPLVVPALNAGDVLVIEFACVAVRLLHLDVFELEPEELSV